MRGASILVILAAHGTLGLELAPPAAAWAPETRLHMVDRARQLMPRSLRLALERYREHVRRGVLEPLTQEDGPAHRPPWDSGTLDAEIERQARALVEAVKAQRPFREVARRFGALAHFVADAGFPPNAAGASGADHYHHFARFCEERREKMPLVFHGHADLDSGAGDFRALALAALERARQQDVDLARAYRLAREQPAPEAFDDRSIPFAIASLAYTQTVTDIVRAWLMAWNEAQGDLGRTPYLRRPPREAEGPPPDPPPGGPRR